jgi:diguanylate cyclase (GGDEF)-like protein
VTAKSSIARGRGGFARGKTGAEIVQNLGKSIESKWFGITTRPATGMQVPGCMRHVRIVVMLVSATLLIQDVQLLCFAIVFGVLALQRWNEQTRRWFWYGLLANTAGAVFDLTATHLPTWISRGINEEMIPLSYALLNVAIIYFDKRSRKAVWVSYAILMAGLPFFLAWRNSPVFWRGDALADLLIALECTLTTLLLVRGKEQSTRAPRLMMGGFFLFFVVVEVVRFVVAFLVGANPDSFAKLEITSAVTYIVDTSLLPLAFIWMMNARLESDLLQQSIVDSLTHVLNRRGLGQGLERELARFRRYGDDLTVAMLDLDHFKQFNDEYGHAAGDAILVAIAELLGNRLRETDVVGRYGGEEFVVLLPHTGLAESGPILEQLCHAIRNASGLLPHTSIRVTASFGATSTEGRRSIDANELLREADVALYQAKQKGRDQVWFFSPEDAAAGPLRPITGLHPAG